MHEMDFGAACRIIDWRALAERTYAHTACNEAATAFKANMLRVNGLLMLPGYAFMSGENWQSCVNAAAKHFFGENRPTDEQFAENEEAMTNLAATLREKALRERSPESAQRSFASASYNIEVFAHQFPPLHGWLHDILKSVIIQAWSAFEVLAEDLHRLSREKHAPLFRSEAVSARYNFRGLKSLNAAFVKLFCRDSRIQNVVGSKEIKAVAVLRHLLVHKNGIIDRRFLEQCSEHPVVTDFAMFKEQQEVLINGEMVRSLVDPALRHGFELIRLVDDWMTDPPAAG